MELLHLVLYLSLMISAGISISLATGMRKRYHFTFLNSLFYLVLFFNLANFFSIVWNSILIDVLKLTEEQVNSVVYFSLQNLFLMIPIYLLFIYFLMKTVLEMGGRTFHMRFGMIYFFTGGAYMLLKMVFLVSYLKIHEITTFHMYAHRIFWMLIKIALLVIPLVLFLWKSRLPEARIRKGVAGFVILYLAGMGLARVLDILNAGDFYVNFVTIVLIVPPLLYLNRQLKYDLTENAGAIEGDDGIEVFFSSFGITKREGEVIGLVARGKSNGEIADLLFLSEQTIKQHMHNIYRKLNVKNRVQLSNLFRNSMKS